MIELKVFKKLVKVLNNKEVSKRKNKGEKGKRKRLFIDYIIIKIVNIKFN